MAKKRAAKKTAKQPAAKKPAANKPAANKPAVKKPTAKPAAKQPAAKKPVAKKPAAKKPAAKKPAAKKPAAKQPAAKKPAAKQPAAKQPAASEWVVRPLVSPLFGGRDLLTIHFSSDGKTLRARSEGLRSAGRDFELSMRFLRPFDANWVAEQLQTIGRYAASTSRSIKAGDNLAFESPLDPKHPAWKGLLLAEDAELPGHLALVMVGNEELDLARNGRFDAVMRKLGLVNELRRKPLGVTDIFDDVVKIPVKVGRAGKPSTIAIARDSDRAMLLAKNLTSVDLRALRGVPVKWLSLEKNQLTKIDLSPLAEVPTLENLSVEDNALATIDLAPLAGLSIQHLALQKNRLTTVDLSPLAKAATLEILALEDNPLGKLDLSPLAGMRSFQQLGLARTGIGTIDLGPLAGTSVELVNVCNCRLRQLDLRPLAGTPLGRLYVAENELVALDLWALARCAELEQLSLHKNPLGAIDLAPLAGCKKLAHLEIGATHVTALDLAPLAQATELVRLFLYDNRIASLDLTPLRKLTKLRTLDLETNNFTELDITPILDLQLDNFVVSSSVRLTARGKSRPVAFTDAEIHWSET